MASTSRKIATGCRRGNVNMAADMSIDSSQIFDFAVDYGIVSLFAVAKLIFCSEFGKYIALSALN